ncbi:2-iminobutanoate/2-iminopropanoate deaminase [Hoeflea marina]|uniref:2-iminobutanoate/2-iminopropanoate deaminase n=1 Tax=Hoeflea marina TaxID=274592 RepID=A0A317PPI3_9HYPH|nr:RidA family protein [Hoeflea marina]PWW01470.1 2-iminobutanoate/2-iminopropanoate deaminase [Hoeflea marina]
MLKTVIAPPSVTVPNVPLSPAIAYKDLVFVSGQLPIDPATGLLAEGITAQTRASLDNLRTVLEAAGASMQSVLKTTVFLKNMDDFGAMNTVYAAAFETDPPARSAIEVARLPKDALVEIEAVAARVN